MIIQKDCWECPQCNNWFFFVVGEYDNTTCPNCNIKMNYKKTYDVDTNHQVPNPNKIICPYCKSDRTNKISNLNRIVSIGFWGIGSNKIGKQWHCTTCNSDF